MSLPALLCDAELNAAIARIKSRAHESYLFKSDWEISSFPCSGWDWNLEEDET